ncbi:uncharacterized protein TNCT_531091 [Trichonephila clavata]|uniref:Ig-like domain-containing protein n=1 Tax=Trichonephila clavata TaxID=2740835 RepID=A0A8X6J6U3_TRICU|nr:uncharacterized protein TNCT_531091 [Trichonephila clavata]
MEGSKNVPVLLLTGKLNRNVRLPCSYCNEKIGISGRKWRKRSLRGNVSDVVLDMHDNPSKNRIFVNSDHSLSIKKVRKEDGGYYFCYDIEDIHGKARMDILLDVVYRTTLVSKEINKLADLGKEVAKWSKPCENLKSISAVSSFECYPEWGAWSKCDKCDQIGQRKRVGECRLQRFVKAKMKVSKNSTLF